MTNIKAARAKYCFHLLRPKMQTPLHTVYMKTTFCKLAKVPTMLIPCKIYCYMQTTWLDNSVFNVMAASAKYPIFSVMTDIVELYKPP